MLHAKAAIFAVAFATFASENLYASLIFLRSLGSFG